MGAREGLMLFGLALLLVGGILLKETPELGVTFVSCSPIPYTTLCIAERFRKRYPLPTEPVIVVKTDS